VGNKEMTDRQILYRLELAYESRKRQNRAYAMKDMAQEIGVSNSTLFSAIRYRRASAETVKKIEKYLEKYLTPE